MLNCFEHSRRDWRLVRSRETFDVCEKINRAALINHSRATIVLLQSIDIEFQLSQEVFNTRLRREFLSEFFHQNRVRLRLMNKTMMHTQKLFDQRRFASAV